MTKISNIPIEDLVQENPIGLDAKIKDMQIALRNEIPWMTTPFGRAEKHLNREGQTFPACYVGNLLSDEYIDVFPDDEVTGMCFFELPDENVWEKNNQWYISNVRIIFYVNLKKAFPNAVHRATMDTINDIRTFIKKHQRYWEFTGFELGVDNVFRQYSLDANQRLVDMQPYQVFAVNTQVRWSSCDSSNLTINLVQTLCEKIADATDEEVVQCIETQGRSSDVCILLNCADIIDPDVQAFIDTYGITNVFEQQAYNDFVLTLKGQINSANPTGIDLWTSKILHWWPLSPTSLAAATGNIRNLSKPITWVNTPTHSNIGVRGNGTTQYAKFGIIPTVDLTEDDTNFCLYSQTNQSRNETDFGCLKASDEQWRGMIRYGSLGGTVLRAYSSAGQLVFSNSISTGFWALEKSGSTLNVYADGVLRGSSPSSSPEIFPDIEVYGMALNLNGSPLELSTKTYSTFGITTALTPDEHSVLSAANAIYQLTVIPGGRLV